MGGRNRLREAAEPLSAGEAAALEMQIVSPFPELRQAPLGAHSGGHRGIPPAENEGS